MLPAAGPGPASHGRAAIVDRMGSRRSDRINWRRILIVDGDVDSRTRLRCHFARRGWSVSSAGTIHEARAALGRTPDCVLLELALRDGPGEAVLRQVAEEGLPTLVVLYTGATDQVRLRRATRLGPAAVLSKSMDLDEVERACQAARAGR
jgi:DNA-binding NtrC family response regulator